MRQNLTLILSLILLLSFSVSKAQAPAAAEEDQFMDMREFQKQALKPKDEVWVVDFWATWCRPCIAAMPHLKELVEKYSDQGVRFISVSWDESRERWSRGIERMDLHWDQVLIPNIRQPQPFIDKNFKHKGIPTAFVIYTSGKIKKVGDVYELENAIGKALNKR